MTDRYQMLLNFEAPDEEEDLFQHEWDCHEPACAGQCVGYKPPSGEWTTRPVDRTGLAAYLHLVRAGDDPERSPRPPAGDPRRDTMAMWRKRLLKDTPACWRDRILAHVNDGQPRTFNRIGVEMLDKTADGLHGTPFETALWELVGLRRVEHTLTAPILFRRVENTQLTQCVKGATVSP